MESNSSSFYLFTFYQSTISYIPSIERYSKICLTFLGGQKSVNPSFGTFFFFVGSMGQGYICLYMVEFYGEFLGSHTIH